MRRNDYSDDGGDGHGDDDDNDDDDDDDFDCNRPFELTLMVTTRRCQSNIELFN